MTPVATLKARRLTGGAVITVTRADGRVHCHRVGLRRYNRLADVLAALPGTGGAFGKNGFDATLRTVAGFAETRKWIQRHYANSRQPKHWRPA
jgi:hypothetical protein